jgi:hypothetical protein
MSLRPGNLYRVCSRLYVDSQAVLNLAAQPQGRGASGRVARALRRRAPSCAPRSRIGRRCLANEAPSTTLVAEGDVRLARAVHRLGPARARQTRGQVRELARPAGVRLRTRLRVRPMPRQARRACMTRAYDMTAPEFLEGFLPRWRASLPTRLAPVRSSDSCASIAAYS